MLCPKLGYAAWVSLYAWSAIRSLFLAIKYAASRYVPDVLFAKTSTNRYDNVLIALSTFAQATPVCGSGAVEVITLSSKYLVILECLGV